MSFGAIDQMVIDFKKEYTHVYSTLINGQPYIWRPLTRFERENAYISANYDSTLYEDLICSYAVLYPKDIDFSIYDKAGVPTMLAKEILYHSGFESTDKFAQAIEYYRADCMQNVITQMEVVIASVFPQYKFEEMREWSVEKLCEVAAKAEFSVKVIKGNMEFSIYTPLDEDEEDTTSVSDDELLRDKEQELLENNIDPILTLGQIYKDRNKKPDKEEPFILGHRYKNEVILDAIRKQQEQCRF